MLLDERYSLEHVRAERQVSPDRYVALWRATDTALGRRVAMLLVTGHTKRSRREVADAATRASRLSDGRCVRVLDIGETELGGEPVTWVATEWVEAPSLTAVLRRGGLRPPLAVELVRQCAEALALAHRQGATHGRLHPDEVLLPPGGRPRITGVEIAAAIAGGESYDDVRGLGALLFAALSGRWPLPGWSGLPKVESSGHRTHVRALDSSLPREVDDVVARALEGGYPDVDTLARALRRLPSQPLDAPEPPKRPGPGVAIRRWAWRLVPPMLVVVIATAGWVIGSDLGKVPQSARTRHAALPAASPTASGAGALAVVWNTPPQVSSFDPEGDGQENEDAAGFAVDHDATTTWTTDLYKHDSHFGGLKSGVGLLIDLGTRATVSRADLVLSAAGSDVELRAGDARPSQASDLPVVETSTPAPAHQIWDLRPRVTARYWLIWFTNLPRAPGGYRIGITDLALLGPAGG